MLLPNLFAAPIVADGAAQGTIGGIIFYITIALAVSGLCSLLEAGLLSTSLSHTEMLVQQGKRSGRVMRNLKTNVEQAISAILTLNTIAHTVGAAGAGAEAAGVFGSEWVGLISIVITLLILVLSEIIPKTIGAVYWKQLFPFTAYTTQVLIWITYPAVVTFQLLTRLITPTGKEPSVTRSELEIMAQIGEGEGTIQETESRIFRNLLHLDKVHVGDIMTPRTVVFALQQDMNARDALKEHKVLPYSRIPVFKESIDDSARFVLRHDILTAVTEQRYDVTLDELARPMNAVPEVLSVAKVLEEFLNQQEHISLVFDEYGGMAGIITLEDAIESLFGLEITDESDLVSDMRELAKARYMRRRFLPDMIAEAERKTGGESDASVDGQTSGRTAFAD